MTRKHLSPLSEAEAERLGQLAARALGDGPDAERLAAQRLRLAQATGSPKTSPEWRRTWAVGGGMVAAAVTVGAVVLIGNWRSNERHAVGGAPAIYAEPLAPRHGEGTGTSDDEQATPKVRATRWRLARLAGETQAGGEQVDVVPGQRLDARTFAVTLELATAEPSPLGAARSAQLRLERGAKARVVESERELVVDLEQGVARAAVLDHDRSAVLLAGPFTVRPVTAGNAAGASAEGAEYDIDWAPGTATLRLTVARGQVQVESEDAREPQRISAGSTLELVAPSERVALVEQRPKSELARSRSRQHAEAKLDVSPASGDSKRGEERQDRPSSDPSGPADVQAVSLSSSYKTPLLPSTADRSQWRKLAENGQYAAAVKAAEQIGFAQLQQTSSASDLLLLADTARLGGQSQKARGVLTALRSRYPGHTNAATAAFTLGRMAQEQEHDDRRAISWYRTYLREEPGGRMAEGARARLLKATLRVGSPSEREDAARDYLAHHPTGSSAAVARSVLVK